MTNGMAESCSMVLLPEKEQQLTIRLNISGEAGKE
jgi:hypothetical protein